MKAVEVARTYAEKVEDILDEWYWGNLELVPEEYRSPGKNVIRCYTESGVGPGEFGLVYFAEDK